MSLTCPVVPVPAFPVSFAQAQTASGQAMAPAFDQPLVASTHWNQSLANPGVLVNNTRVPTLGGTYQVRLLPLRNCRSFRLVYANAEGYEGSATNPVTLRASLIVNHNNGQAPTVRRVTFNGGNPEVALGAERMIVSDPIPEYWDVQESGATATVRTFARLNSTTHKFPLSHDVNPAHLPDGAAQAVLSADAPEDLTLAPAHETAFQTRGVVVTKAVMPVAMIGETLDPQSVSIAILGGSSIADSDSYIALALRRDRIPYVMLANPGQTFNYFQYGRRALRGTVASACTHAFVQYGRSDIGFGGLNFDTAAHMYQIKANAQEVWGMLKASGLWVSQATVSPWIQAGGNYTDPSAQTSSPRETLCWQFNDWIRAQAGSGVVDRFYEVADLMEYMPEGAHTGKWNYLVDASGNRIALTRDGLHPSQAGHTLLSSLMDRTQFVYDPKDTVPPYLASAIVPSAGNKIILTFNEAKSAPLATLANIPGFSVTVEGQARTLSSASRTAPKEITLTLSGGGAILRGQAVTVQYTVVEAQAITDSASPTPNALQSFGPLNTINNSTPTSLTPPQMAVSQVRWARSATHLTATVTLKNLGQGPATSASLSSATLDTTASTSALPVSLGSIPAGSTVTTTLNWPLLPSRTTPVLRLSGSYEGGTFACSIRTTLP